MGAASCRERACASSGKFCPNLQRRTFLAFNFQEQMVFAEDRKETRAHLMGTAYSHRSSPTASPSHSNATDSQNQGAGPYRALGNYPLRDHVGSIGDPLQQYCPQTQAKKEAVTRARRSSSFSEAPSIPLSS